MSDHTVFAGFMQRIRSGDEQAAELVEPLRAGDPPGGEDAAPRSPALPAGRLGGHLPVGPGQFFYAGAAGSTTWISPDQLLRLLVVMTRHKLSKQARRHRAEKPRLSAGGGSRSGVVGSGAAAEPDTEPAAGRELLETFRARPEEERMLADLRG